MEVLTLLITLIMAVAEVVQQHLERRVLVLLVKDMPEALDTPETLVLVVAEQEPPRQTLFRNKVLLAVSVFSHLSTELQHIALVAVAVKVTMPLKQAVKAVVERVLLAPIPELLVLQTPEAVVVVLGQTVETEVPAS